MVSPHCHVFDFLLPSVFACVLIPISVLNTSTFWQALVTVLILGFDNSTLSQRLLINVLLKSCILDLFMIHIELVPMWLGLLCKDSPRFYLFPRGSIWFFRFISERYVVATRSGI